MRRFVTALSGAAAIVLVSPSLALGAGTLPGGPGPVPPVSTDGGAALLERLGLGLPPLPAAPPSLAPTPPAAGEEGATPVGPAQATPSDGDPFPGLGPDAYAGYGTGTAFSSDAELSGVGVAVEKAFSSAVYGSRALPARSNEVDRPATPDLDPGHGFGAASAADIGEGDDRLEIPDDISASAPPNGDAAEGEVADISLLPLLHADLFRTRATARSAGDGCVIGSDLASGRAITLRSDVPGDEDDAERPLLTISDDDPARALTESYSRVGLLPPASEATARFGIFSETRQTIAPVTFLKGTPNEVTVELAGEWVLRVASDGGEATVSYGPDADDPLAPVLRIDRRGDDSDVILTAQDIAGSEGEDISTPGVEEFIIAERPRIIGGDTGSSPLATATRVSAAVDVLRLLIPDDREADGLIEVVVGHMEAAVALPAGGISCPGIAMAKEASTAEVQPGDEFTWTVTVANPNHCLLERVSLKDTIRTPRSLRYEITGTDPEPSRRDGDALIFTGFRALGLGESFAVTVTARVAEDSRPGSFTNDVISAGACRSPDDDDAVILSGEVSLAAPSVSRPDRVKLPAPGPASSATPGAVTSERVLLGRPTRLSRTPPRPSGVERATRELVRTGGLIAVGPGLLLMAVGTTTRRCARRRS